MIDGIETQLQRIAATIESNGFCLVREEELTLLFGDGDSGSRRFPFLAKLAHEHEWSFEFHPRDGQVRISRLPANGISPNSRFEQRVQKVSSNGSNDDGVYQDQRG